MSIGTGRQISAEEPSEHETIKPRSGEVSKLFDSGVYPTYIVSLRDLAFGLKARKQRWSGNNGGQ
jgi:hypothetical protein